MYENISLIKEVKENLSRDKAEEVAAEYLHKVALSHIGLLRVSQCTAREIFYTMFIRALMSKKNSILIVLPYSLIKNLTKIDTLIKNIEILNDKKKNILLIDTVTNENRYKGYSCHIIK